ncbi:MAG TPA: hypothetical protein VFW80_12510 [Gaiellaceae bacterium]|nr:hypothetical protein [Gaiellaceae bacterium]
MAVATRPGGALRCVKCGDLASGRARGWRAYIAEPDEDDLFEYVVVYCPRCGEREFGPLGFE